MVSQRGNNTLRKRPARAHRHVRLRVTHTPALGRYIQSMARETYLFQVVLLLIMLWLLFAAALYLSERNIPGTDIGSYGEALYWGIAALSTAGIANTPSPGLSQAIGGAWIIIGSFIFFGTIVASITGYFMRPVQRPARRIVEAIEFNLDNLDDLSIEELELLKKTTDGLITHMERIRLRDDAST